MCYGNSAPQLVNPVETKIKFSYTTLTKFTVKPAQRQDDNNSPSLSKASFVIINKFASSCLGQEIQQSRCYMDCINLLHWRNSRLLSDLPNTQFSNLGSVSWKCLIFPTIHTKTYPLAQLTKMMSELLFCNVCLTCYYNHKSPKAWHLNDNEQLKSGISLNVRGLSNTVKRCEMFWWLKTKKYTIFFLQEVHCSEDKEKCWTSEWGYSAIFSSLSSASARVSILFNNTFSFHILKTNSDPKGRFIIVDIKTESKNLTLANIYAANNDDPFFFENVFKHLFTFECKEIILGGDFNLVLDVKKDKKVGNPVTREKSLLKGKYIINSLDLTDIWHLLNMDTNPFTWRKGNP